MISRQLGPKMKYDYPLEILCSLENHSKENTNMKITAIKSLLVVL